MSEEKLVEETVEEESARLLKWVTDTYQKWEWKEMPNKDLVAYELEGLSEPARAIVGMDDGVYVNDVFVGTIEGIYQQVLDLSK